ncbi:antigen 5 like allergen Cul n 1-like [Rhagoletis pomonella]|uniref:antigen 5 like allergen Cul n 1-like n=1 Tax=Rhagoletis pomonella TaxID=28610 RepID=UPI0017846B2F|nr:antigen 5 like allergen Cul n 1-like [Rhagoletis pomonella]
MPFKHTQSAWLLFFGVQAVFISFVFANAWEKLDWCDPSLCPNGKWHVACRSDGRFAENCPEDATLFDLRQYRQHILHEHNKRRNFVALGELPGYYPAARMATMVWDEELAFLASLNLKMCYVEHDDCNNSYRFPSVGQNLSGVDRRHDLEANVTDIIAMSMGLWFGEYPLIDSSYIRSFRVSSNFEKYGHFAEMMIDRNTHVGCAMSRYTHPAYPFLYIYNTACNYASKYALETPVYRVGASASECTTGPNPKYPGLCSAKEKFNPNYN